MLNRRGVLIGVGSTVAFTGCLGGSEESKSLPDLLNLDAVDVDRWNIGTVEASANIVSVEFESEADATVTGTIVVHEDIPAAEETYQSRSDTVQNLFSSSEPPNALQQSDVGTAAITYLHPEMGGNILFCHKNVVGKITHTWMDVEGGSVEVPEQLAAALVDGWRESPVVGSDPDWDAYDSEAEPLAIEDDGQ